MKVGRTRYQTVWMKRGTVHLVDQNLLPYKFRIRKCRTVEETARAIENMTVRGAGAIGVAAGFGVAQGVLAVPRRATSAALLKRLRAARARIERTRPTARNLFYASGRVYEACVRASHDPAKAREAALSAAGAIAREDARAAFRIGEIGERLIRSGDTILTHCNAGWLAFSDWGTALAPVYLAHRRGKKVFVYADETRPRSQGARLTAWELSNEGVPHAVIADAAAGSLLSRGKVRLVIVGADRIAANGDTANKIGTYPLAVVARENRVPFYVAAPLSTFDETLSSGREIPIENRHGSELFDARWFRALKRSRVENPAFDVTPARYITGIITERGIVKPARAAIRRLLARARL